VAATARAGVTDQAGGVPAVDRHAWFDAMARDYEEAAFRLALWLVRDRATAEDLVQDALVRLWGSRNLPGEDAAFRNWLLRTVGNLALDHIRRGRVMARLRFWEESRPDPFAQVEDRLGHPKLQRALAALAPRERRLVYLACVDGLPHAVTAAIIGTSEGNVRVLLHRTLGKLRTHLDEVDAHE
jgi:RNA polymerase sigma-70 factor (ECF subfamily)